MVAASGKGLVFGIARKLAITGATVCIAKRTKTRESRVQKIIPLIFDNRGLNDKYKK